MKTNRILAGGLALALAALVSTTSFAAQAAKPGSPAKAKATRVARVHKAAPTGKINLNTLSASELTSLPGSVGNTRAVHSQQASSGQPIPGAHQPRRALDGLAGPSGEDAWWARSGSRRRLRRPVAVPDSRPPLCGLLHPVALTVVFDTERLPAEHVALPVRGTAPR